jgi:hypothetical protein
MSAKPPSALDMSQYLMPPPDPMESTLFPNGSSYEAWKDDNCEGCKWYSPETNVADAPCAFDAAMVCAMFSDGRVSQTLVDRFIIASGTCYLGACRFRTPEDDNDGERERRSPPHDPAQLVLIADPTEIIAGLVPAQPETLAHADR